jgi:His-Xaa-Ser system radical SAM maturase HxsC
MKGRRFSFVAPNASPPIVAKVTTNPTIHKAFRDSLVLVGEDPIAPLSGFLSYLTDRSSRPPWGELRNVTADWFSDGDVIWMNPSTGTGEVLYRPDSPHNTLYVTERCNCLCAMCAQPPRTATGGPSIAELKSSIPLMAPNTAELGISGGEPTLLGAELVGLIRATSSYLPKTSIHLLTNARALSDSAFAAAVADAGAGRLFAGVPINSDVPRLHDEIVGVNGAFSDTVSGILNLHKHRVPVEIRVVLTRPAVRRLRGIARFVQDCLPFAQHIAFMGLELVGQAVPNFDDVWVDPQEIEGDLAAAVTELAALGFDVSMYNIPLCGLSPDIREFAKRSISDWKVEFRDECAGCAARQKCCGFFGTDKIQNPMTVHPIQV